MKARLVLLLALCTLIALGGCLGAPTEQQPVVDFAIINGSTSSADGATVFKGEVAALDVYTGQFRIEHLRVEFLDSSNNVFQTHPIGTVNSTDFRQSISVSVERAPTRIRLRAESVTTRALLNVHGLTRTESGRYVSFRQDSLED